MKSDFEILIRSKIFEFNLSLSGLANEEYKKGKKLYSSGVNLGTAIKDRRLSDDKLAYLCQRLELDLGVVFKLKVK
jgi:hypothetical protein